MDPHDERAYIQGEVGARLTNRNDLYGRALLYYMGPPTDRQRQALIDVEPA